MPKGDWSGSLNLEKLSVEAPGGHIIFIFVGLVLRDPHNFGKGAASSF